MKKTRKTIIKNTAKTAAVLGGLVLGGYHFSEKIGYIQHDVQKEITDNLGKKEILVDKETNDIIKLMCGKLSQKEFDELLAIYGYKNPYKIDTIIHPDEALYKTILEMQTKYTNPKISFAENFKDNKIISHNERVAGFNIFTNTIEPYQLDSTLLDLNKPHIDNKNNGRGLSPLRSNTRQKRLLNQWISELAHSKQLQENGAIRMSINGSIDYFHSGFNYNKTYNMEKTDEYQAHKIYEPMLVQEFITTYEKYLDTTSTDNIRAFIKFNYLFFGTFEDDQKIYTYLKILEQKGDIEANKLLRQYLLDVYIKNFFSKKKNNDTVYIGGKQYTAESLSKECLMYFKKKYIAGDIYSGYKLIDFASSYMMGNTEFVLEIANDLLTNHINELSPDQRKNIYYKTGMIYYYQGDNKKGDEYINISNTYK